MIQGCYKGNHIIFVKGSCLSIFLAFFSVKIVVTDMFFSLSRKVDCPPVNNELHYQSLYLADQESCQGA